MKLVVLLALVPFAYGVYLQYPCPDWRGVQGDLDKSLGKWYVVKRTDDLFDSNYDCEEVNFTRKGNKIVGKFSGKNVTNGGAVEHFELINNVDYVDVADFHGEIVKNGQSYVANVKYVYADDGFASYVVPWMCRSLPDGGSDRTSWILSRKRTVDQADLQRMYNFFDQINYRHQYLNDAKQSGC